MTRIMFFLIIIKPKNNVIKKGTIIFGRGFELRSLDLGAVVLPHT